MRQNIINKSILQDKNKTYFEKKLGKLYERPLMNNQGFEPLLVQMFSTFLTLWPKKLET